ncbi:MAG: tol-pal system-associated acyl-CoA thioesterase [Pseudomonadota bacterium]|nr:tol-pal system-associated acyl-CoA thioesterase [Pseudomonadota bacterium]
MPFEYPFRVYLEDTDAGGIVYHANHLKFCERARTEWLRAQAIEHYLHAGDYSFVVHRLSIDYHQPAKIGDLLQVTVQPIACQSASFRLQQIIRRAEMPIASVHVSLACLDANLRPRRLPENIRDLLHQQMIEDETRRGAVPA